MGIPAKDLERIFERFYRVDPGRARETGGTGLGLSIVRHVAQNHGGNVLVESREGEGSTFTLELPMTHLSENSRARSASTSSRRGRGVLRRRPERRPRPRRLRRRRGTRRPEAFALFSARTLRHRAARPHAAQDVRAGRLPLDPADQRGAHHHRERQGRRGRYGADARDRRRRLRDQALPTARAGRAHSRRAASSRDPRQRPASDDEKLQLGPVRTGHRRATLLRRRRGDQTAQEGVRPVTTPARESRPGPDARGADRSGLGQ